MQTADHRVKERYATVCVTLRPDEMPKELLKKILSISASKLGTGKVSLASHLMIILNVQLNDMAGRITPEVLLLRDPEVLTCSRAGEAHASGAR
ncbi:MAG: hypothetical protein RMJ07_06915 [Nitrososphaerota archaeon]|nr:hypothetical protein [Candidatus Bathyarchaeota archaeon]MDW8049385.1 hypothetical protein [Nitrososphaerota archaeon]